MSRDWPFPIRKVVYRSLAERIASVRAEIKRDVPELFNMPTFVIFNAWPQCKTKQECNKKRQCIEGCSSIKGVILTENRCPWDDWKPARDIG